MATTHWRPRGYAADVRLPAEWPGIRVVCGRSLKSTTKKGTVVGIDLQVIIYMRPITGQDKRNESSGMQACN